MRFFEPSDTPRVKVCGLRNPDNAREVIAAGADAIGINFWPQSKRFVELDVAADWLGVFAGQVCRVGLFVNATLGEIEKAAGRGVLDAIQLHGDESPEFCEKVAALGLPVIKAIAVRDDSPLHDPGDFPNVDLLLDAYAGAAFGGTGRSFRWDVARRVIAENPQRRIILAGGLTPENVASAICETSPHAVDVASGVESAPGVKDRALVRRFVANTRSANG